MITQVLARASVTARDLTTIACGVGPGPYTGLRVGLATAVAMGAALDIPVVGMCSLDIIAEQWRSRAGEHLLVATDARRREVYVGAYADGRRTLGPLVLRPGDAVTAAPQIRIAVGAGAVLYREVLAECGVSVPEGAAESAYPDAGVLAGLVAAAGEAAIAAAATSTTAVTLDDARGSGAESTVPLGLLPPRALYLRRPDAMEPGR